jgi:hypothetical protein
LKALLFIAPLLAAAPAAAETAAALVAEAIGLEQGQVRKISKAAEVGLRELSGFSVKESVSLRKGAPRRGCGEDAACMKTLAREAGADHAMLLYLKASGGSLAADAWFIDLSGAARPIHRQIADGSLDEPEATVKSLVEATLPAYARKGWGGVVVKPAPGAKVAQIKIDGRKVSTSNGEPIAVTSSVHSIDVLFDSGQAVLQRTHVPEGERLALDVAPSAAIFAPSGTELVEGNEKLRLASYGLWGAGAVAVASSLLVGAASRDAASKISSCQGEVRDCPTLSDARKQHEQATAYARTGNLLLGTGVALSAAGAGLFAFDLVQAKKD